MPMKKKKVKMVIYYSLNEKTFPTITGEVPSISVGNFVEQVDAMHEDSDVEFHTEYEV